MLVHSSFFMAYLMIPFAAALLIRRRGFRVGLIAATGLMGVAALLCVAGIENGQLGPPGLAAIFVAAAGIAGLQTAGNPAITLLGEPQTRARRLFAVQSMSSLGSSVGPLAVAAISAQRRLDPIMMLRGVRGAYAGVGMALLLLTLGLCRSSATLIASSGVARVPARIRLSPHLLAAMVGVCLFVGTEATVLSHVVRYQHTFSAHPTEAPWALTLSCYWLVMAAGRLLFLAAFRKLPLVVLLRMSALCGALLILAAMLLRSDAGVYALVGTGVVNAAIFPAIFALSTEHLPAQELATSSGWLTTAICGGGLIPFLSGALVDRTDLRAAFVIPIVSYVWISATAHTMRATSSTAPGIEQVGTTI
jgi:FHS family L-fucose permease-like MFS transporter